MKKEKYNHNAEDFATALHLDKDELFDIAIKGFELHLTKGEPLSKCIVEIVNGLVENKSDEIKIFAAGIVFSQILSMTQDELIETGDLHKSKTMVMTKKDFLPFTTKDLLKSIRDEMENDNGKESKDNGSN